MATFNEILTATKELCSILDGVTTYDTFLGRQLNAGQAHFARDLNWKFSETTRSTASVQYKYKYDLDSDIDVIKGVIYGRTHHPKPVSHNQWLLLNEQASYGNPQYYYNWEGQLCFSPQPNESGTTEVLSEDMSYSQSTLRLATVTALEPKGIGSIDREVIEWSHIDTDNKELQGVIRGVEGSIASHITGDTFTDHNIIYTGYKVLSDMVSGDTSSISVRYHDALPLYAASKYFEKVEQPEQAQRYWQLYMEIKEQAKKDLGEKQDERFSTTLDDTVGQINFRDNTYPEDSSLT
jgi:hypothetical protein